MVQRLAFHRGDPTGTKLEALAETRGRMLLVIKTRWILLLLLCFYGLYAGSLVLCSRAVDAIEIVPAAALAGSLLAAILFNLFFHLLYRELSSFPLVNHLQILLDIIITSVIIHYSGGIFSPFWPVYAILALEASLLLEGMGGVWALCTIASLAYGALIWAESVALVPSVSIPFSEDGLRRDAVYCLLMWSWVSTLTAAMGIIGLMVAGVVRRRESALKQLVVKDQMTGLYNRGYFFKELNSEIQRSIRYNHVFSVIFLDIDDFKNFNDSFGHLEGDRLLKEVARILRSKARRSETDPPYDIDVPCRYGGEEFSVILPETPIRTTGHGLTEGMNALAFAERIRQEVASLAGSGTGITVSIGVAAFPEHGITPDELVRTVDEALYRSKKEGKNRIVIAERPVTPNQNGISSSGLNVGSSYDGEAPYPLSSDTLPPP
jgi:diguanylate cyclase (GGDEF)-like protein